LPEIITVKPCVAHHGSDRLRENRSFDFYFPVKDYWKLGGDYTWRKGGNLDLAVGGTLYLYGDAPIDQTDQSVRAAGDFDSYTNRFVGGTLR
jgi:hypothetical protein